MGVLLQAFYWDCPALNGLEFKWWTHLQSRLPGLKKAGFSALWLPPVSKAANARSMGYDPYDYYDLGEFQQKGAKSTWFGSREELESLIAEAHRQEISVYADMVLNHNSGGDALEANPLDQMPRWTRFTPLSGKFPRNWSHFHPCKFESWDQASFGEMPDLCHRNPEVYREILELARWMVEEIGFDGFRYDMVKGYGDWVVSAIQEYRYANPQARPNGQRNYFKPFGVGEFWDNTNEIRNWLSTTNATSDNPVSAFDFPLRSRLKEMCVNPSSSLELLADGGTLSAEFPFQSVTFVENHDTDRGDPILRDKLMAYAYILTHPGYPCVYWADYMDYGLGKEGLPTGIEALVQAHERAAGGNTLLLHADPSFYAAARTGDAATQGLVLALNGGAAWQGRLARTHWPKTRLVPIAWSGEPGEAPLTQTTREDGSIEVWAPPRGYVVYVPER